MLEKMSYGLRNPDRVFTWFKWNTAGRISSLMSKLSLKSQKDLVHDSLLEEERFVLIVLDACRYDYFVEHYDDFFEGELDKVYSEGRHTFEYLSNMWNEENKDILYISGNPVVNSKQGDEWGVGSRNGDPNYDPGKYLRISNLWDDLWDNDLCTVLPGDLIEKAESRMKIEDKVILHFNQPHAPYIGDYRLKEVSGDKILNADQSFQRLSTGEVESSEIRKAYRSNLIHSLEELKGFVEDLDDRRVVITSDHGEMFGEMGIIGHPSKEHPLLREVPWLEVEDVIDNSKNRI